MLKARAADKWFYESKDQKEILSETAVTILGRDKSTLNKFANTIHNRHLRELMMSVRIAKRNLSFDEGNKYYLSILEKAERSLEDCKEKYLDI